MHLVGIGVCSCLVLSQLYSMYMRNISAMWKSHETPAFIFGGPSVTSSCQVCCRYLHTSPG